MSYALKQAELAAEIGEVPVGAVIVDEAGNLLSHAYNRVEMENDITAHAEILAVKAAAKALHNWRLTGCTLYVTLEPCGMCAFAIMQSRLRRLVFAAWDDQKGAYEFLLQQNKRRQLCIDYGIKEEESKNLLKKFFCVLREEKRTNSKINDGK